MVLLFLWGPLVKKMFPPIKVEQPATNQVATATATGAETNATGAQAAPVILGDDGTAVAQPVPAVETPAEPEKEAVLENDLFKLTFTSRGGGVKLIELKDYEREVTCNGEGSVGPAVLNANAQLPVLAIRSDNRTYDWQPSSAGGLAATAEWPGGLRVSKEFVLSSNYMLTAKMRFENTSDQRLKLPGLEWSLGASTPLGSSDDDRFTGLLWFDGDDKEHIEEMWFQNRFLGCFPRTPHTTYTGGSSNVVWAGMQNQFFTILTLPESPAAQVTARRFELPPPTAAELEANPKRNQKPMGHQGGLIEGDLVIDAGATVERNFTLYIGPKEYNTLSLIALEQGNHLDLVMNFSGFFGFFAKALLLSMNSLHNSMTIGYGLAIVFITIIIKLVFWPLTNASTKSMKRMAKLQPQMKALQEKYKEDPQKMQRKLMEFMKENKVNPMGSCLPLLLQMPIFIGFYTMLQSAIELRGAGFLWICDLSRPDTLFYVPGFGLPFNLMPLIMGGTMLYQAQLTPMSPGMDPVQQKMMRYMPLIFVLFLYNMSSGLTLYWTVQNLLSIVQTKLTRTDDDKPGATPPAKQVAGPKPAAGHPKKKR